MTLLVHFVNVLGMTWIVRHLQKAIQLLAHLHTDFALFFK